MNTNDSLDSFTIRVPYHTIESISKILFYQNEQLLHEIAKFKGWNRDEIVKPERFCKLSILNLIFFTNTCMPNRIAVKTRTIGMKQKSIS